MPQEQKLPTTLNLFEFNPKNLPVLAERKQRADERLVHGVRALDATVQGGVVSRLRVQRLEKAGNELHGDITDIVSSVTYGQAYLKLSEELEAEGRTPEEIYGFFKVAADLNTQYLGMQSFNTFRDYVPVPDAERAKWWEEKAKKNPPPSWYRGSIRDWPHYLFIHGSFLHYLNREEWDKASRNNHVSNWNTWEKLGVTTPQGVPNWFSQETPPSKATIEDQLREDLEDFNKSRDQFDNIHRQVDTFRQGVNKKIESINARMQDQEIKIFAPINTFGELMLYLGESHRYSRTILERVYAPVLKEYPDTPFVYEYDGPQFTATVLAKCIRWGTAVSAPESYALWMEKHLRQGGLLPHADNPLEGGLYTALKTLIDGVAQSPEQARPDYERIAGQDKRTFRSLFFELRPLFQDLTEDEQEYLSDLADDYQGQPVQGLLWELATFFAKHNTGKEVIDFTPRQATVLTDLTKNTKSWLTQHWEWGYQDLLNKLANPKPTPEPIEEFNIPLEQEVQNLEETTAEIGHGNLDGWQVVYASSNSLKDKDLIPIQGETLEEREKFLKDLIGRHRLTCTINPGSVIEALDWAVGVPEEVTRRWVQVELDGEHFYSMKRGKRMRIYFNLDRDQKRATFSLYYKKFWDYNAKRIV